MLSAELFGVAPADLLLVGIKGDAFEPGCSLSVPVQSSLEQAIAEVLNELDRLGISYWHREHPEALDTWWAIEAAEPALAE